MDEIALESLKAAQRVASRAVFEAQGAVRCVELKVLEKMKRTELLMLEAIKKLSEDSVIKVMTLSHKLIEMLPITAKAVVAVRLDEQEKWAKSYDFLWSANNAAWEVKKAFFSGEDEARIKISAAKVVQNEADQAAQCAIESTNVSKQTLQFMHGIAEKGKLDLQITGSVATQHIQAMSESLMKDLKQEQHQ